MAGMTIPAHEADQARVAGEDGTAAIEALETAFRRITQVLKRSAREFSTAVHPELRPAGWVVLSSIMRGAAEGRPVTVGEVIADTGMDKSVVSRQLRSLNDWGLVTMSRSEADARVVVVEGSPLAHERLGVVRRQQRLRYAQILGDWPTEDVARLGELLNRVADSFSD